MANAADVDQATEVESAAPKKQVVVVKGAIISIPDIQDFYPRSARSRKLEGMAKVEICINERGDVVGAKVKESTGHDVLDKAALKMAHQFRYRAPTIDSVPQAECYTQMIRFSAR